jgi:hypothetical protein
MRRRDYFEPPIQALFALSRYDAFAEKADEFEGYDSRGWAMLFLYDGFKFIGHKFAYSEQLFARLEFINH